MPVTQLSRSEVMTLLYDKLNTIREEADTILDPEAQKPGDLSHAGKRIRRIAIEAKRAAALIDTYEICSKAGHCTHCGKTYDEHLEERPPHESGAPLVRAKDRAAPRCVELKKFFESIEIETYQGVQIAEVG